MPIVMGLRRRDTTTKLEQTSEGTGWEAIQESMLSHDGDKFGDFADDIDTLLVFAGLFSAILTAFLVGSIANLKQDNTQLSVQLLALIALQNGAPAGVSSFLNSTATSIPSSLASPAAGIDVVINTLWFMGLVFSLAAALLGILAKQWCREYLMWHSAIAPARTNVLLRQMRYEAWKRWRVATFITSIPPLLEIALVLFFAGLACFTWTLQRIIAIIVTALAAVTVALAFVLTLLPVFYRLCPFKTPTGWAFVLLTHLFHHPMNHRWAVDPEKLTDWRARDLRITVDPNLCDKHLDHVVGLTLDPGTQPRHQDITVDALHVRYLTTALAWMQQGSTEDRVSRVVARSIEHLHDPRRRYEQSTKQPFFHSSMNTLALVSGWTKSHPVVASFAQDFLYDYLPGNHPLNRAYGAVQLAVADCEDRDYMPGPYFATVLGKVTEDDTMLLRICRKVVYHDLLSLTEGYIYACGTEDMNNKKVVARRIAMVLAFLRCTPPGLANCLIMEEDMDEWAQVLTIMFHRLSQQKAAFCDGLISMILELLCYMGEVSVDIFKHEVSVEKFTPQNGSGFITNWADFSVRLFDASSNYTDRNIRHLFVVSLIPFFGLVSNRLRSSSFCGLNVLELNSLDKLMACIVKATKISLDRHYKDCGGYVQLQWLFRLHLIYLVAQQLGKPIKDVVFTGQPGIRERFLCLLSLLRMSIEADLLFDPDAQREQLDCLLKLIGNPVLPSLSQGDSAYRMVEQRSSEPGIEGANLKQPNSTSSVKSTHLKVQDDVQSITLTVLPALNDPEPRATEPFPANGGAIGYPISACGTSPVKTSSGVMGSRPIPASSLSMFTPPGLPRRCMSDSPAPMLNVYDRSDADEGKRRDSVSHHPSRVRVRDSTLEGQWAAERPLEKLSLPSVTSRRASWDPLGMQRGSRGAPLKSRIVSSAYASDAYDLDASEGGGRRHRDGMWGSSKGHSDGLGPRTTSRVGIGEHDTV